MLSSPVFAKPHFRPLILTLLPRAPAPRAGSYDTNYLGSPHPNRAFCGSRAETLPNRPASPETAPQNIANSTPQAAYPRPPLHQTANSRLLFSTRCALFYNYWGGGGSPLRSGFHISSFEFRVSIFSISFRIRTYKPTPRFTVFCPNSSARKPFRIRIYRIRVRKLFRIRAYKKHGGRGVPVAVSVNNSAG